MAATTPATAHASTSVGLMSDSLRCTVSLADPRSACTRLDLDLRFILIPYFSVGYNGLKNYNID